jgi:hypothetical protein
LDTTDSTHKLDWKDRSFYPTTMLGLCDTNWKVVFSRTRKSSHWEVLNYLSQIRIHIYYMKKRKDNKWD